MLRMQWMGSAGGRTRWPRRGEHCGADAHPASREASTRAPISSRCRWCRETFKGCARRLRAPLGECDANLLSAQLGPYLCGCCSFVRILTLGRLP